jgi:hypothetical protein
MNPKKEKKENKPKEVGPKITINERIHDKSLEKKIIQAQKKDGYLICLTELDGDKLNHTYWTKTFKHGDIVSSLEEWHKLLEPLIKKDER